MKRRDVLYGLLAAAAPIGIGAFGDLTLAGSRAVAAGPLAKRYPVVNNPGIPFGAYDPHGDFKDVAGLSIEHLFLPWLDVDLSTLPIADAYAIERGRTLLITIEPWSWSKDKRVAPDQLRHGVLSGEYDPIIENVTRAISALKSEVTIRFAHEMENQLGRFSWSGWNPQDYVSAYRRFVDIARRNVPKAKFMWSPEGRANLGDYYPGDRYADLVGLTIFGLQRYDNDKFGKDRTFAEILKPSYDLVTRYRKPIIVAETGYVGDLAYVDNWATTLNQPDASFPGLTAIVYFDDKEVHPWPDPYGLPDWRVVPQSVL